MINILIQIEKNIEKKVMIIDTNNKEGPISNITIKERNDQRNIYMRNIEIITQMSRLTNKKSMVTKTIIYRDRDITNMKIIINLIKINPILIIIRIITNTIMNLTKEILINIIISQNLIILNKIK